MPDTPKTKRTIDVGVIFEETEIGIEMHLRFEKSHPVEDYDERALWMAKLVEMGILETIKSSSTMEPFKRGTLLMTLHVSKAELPAAIEKIRKQGREMFKKDDN